MNLQKKPKTIKELWDNCVMEDSNKEFLMVDGNSYTFGEIDNLANRSVTNMKSMGIQHGDILSLQFELNLENIVNILAGIKLGTILNPLNPHFDNSEIKNLSDKFKPYAIFAQKAPRHRDTIFYIENLHYYNSTVRNNVKYFTRKKRHNLIELGNSNINRPVLILNTSGTTGAPKGVVLTNKNILDAEYGYVEAFKIRNNDMIAMFSGMYHAIGFHHGLIATLISKSKLFIMEHYSLEKLAEALKRYPITYIDSVPTIMYDILFKTSDLGKLRQLICGGDKIKKDFLLKAKERNIPLYNCYGLTEAVPFSYTPPEYFNKKKGLTTAVKPIEGVSIRLMKNGKEVIQINQQGLIEVKGSIIFREYLQDKNKTKEAFDGKWFITGDLGHYNSDYLLEIDGRNSDKIIRGGENVSAKVVEDNVLKCPNIKEAVVIGISDVRLGQKIGAFVSLKNPQETLTKTKLISELISLKVDKKFWPEKLWVIDKFPRTANGKVKKYVLRQRIENCK